MKYTHPRMMSTSAPTSTAAGKAVPEPGPGRTTLDAAKAIELLDNSTTLYLEIAQAYSHEIVELGQRIVDLLRQSRQAEATRALHTVKGLSLTVGANLLSDVCRQCELQLKAAQQESRVLDDADCQRMKVTLDSAVAQTQLALQAVLPRLDSGEAQIQSAEAPVDYPALVTDLCALQDLLSLADLQALARYTALCAAYPALHDALQELNQAIKIFDFPQAVVQCAKLIRTFSDPIRR
jgi:HPt (histidine-containing phosphotransfer) domain-containing protein